MEKILILIPTYNRNQSLLNLLHDIKKFSNNYTIELLIYNDCSDDNYQPSLNYLHENFRYNYFKTSENAGKQNYYQLINAAYNQVKLYEFDYFFQFADDFRLVDGFFDKAIKMFNSIPDEKKACMNIENDYVRYGMQMWTHVKTREVVFNGIHFHKTGWIDMAFICKRNFFELIDFTVNRVEPIYIADKELSSGVGAQLSKRLIQKNATIYQVLKSLVIHDNHASVMHPEHRTRNPIISNHENVTAGMATMPGREKALKETVDSIINQVDRLIIYLNDIQTVYSFLRHPKIELHYSDKELGDLGDAGKFFMASMCNGYYFSIDDDLIYPPDYVQSTILNIEKYNRKKIVTYHGRSFINTPVKSYYHGAEYQVSCLKKIDNDSSITVPGTGVMAYHTNTIQFSIDDFKASNMADIWAAKKAKELNIEIICLKHQANWIRQSLKINHAETIYANCNKKDDFQTKVINSFL